MRRIWPLLAVLGLTGALAYRGYTLLAIPGIAGADPYTRLWMRDTIWVELFGRPWLPGLQSLIVSVYSLGGGLMHIKWLMFGLSAAMLVSLGAYLWRRFGLAVAAIATAALACDPDIWWVSAAPYQESLFYLGVGLCLLGLARLERVGKQSRLAWVTIFGACSILVWTRYEGLVWMAGLAAAMAWHPGTSRRMRLAWGVLGFGVPAAMIGWVLRNAGLGVVSPSGELPDSGPLEHTHFLADYLLGSSAALWLVPAVIGTVVAYRHARTRDLVTHDLFLLGFVGVYIGTAPYLPAANRRFHIPLIVWLTCRGAVGIVHLIRSQPHPRSRALATTLAAGIVGAACLLALTSSRELVERSAAKHLSPARAGAVAEHLLPPGSGLLMAWSPGDYHGFPGRASMRIAAQLRGPSSRIVFAPTFEQWPRARRREYLTQTAGGVLLRKRKGDSKGVRARHKRIEPLLHELFPGRLNRARIAGGYHLYTWNGPAPEQHVGTSKTTSQLPIDLRTLGLPGLRAIAGDLNLARLEDVRWHPGWWPSVVQLVLRVAPDDPEARRLELALPLETATTQLELRFTASHTGGNLRILLDGIEIGTQNLFASEPESRSFVHHQELSPGIHHLVLELAAGTKTRQLALAEVRIHPSDF